MTHDRIVAARRVRRMLITALALGLIGLLAVLLLRSVWSPDVRMFVLTSREAGSASVDLLNVPPGAVAKPDLRGLVSLGNLLRGAESNDAGVLWRLREPHDVRRLGARLRGVTTPADIVILYLAACGTTESGTAWLCAGFDPVTRGLRRERLQDWLDQIEMVPASVKLWILDGGSVEYDPRSGIIANEFARLLEQAVVESGDPSLWVLAPRLNAGAISRSLGQSPFGHFVARGLRGEADLDRSGAIGLDELYRFVSARLQAGSGAGSDEAQPVVLFWGGGRELRDRNLPTLLPVLARQLQQQEATEGASSETADGATPAVALFPEELPTTGPPAGAPAGESAPNPSSASGPNAAAAKGTGATQAGEPPIAQLVMRAWRLHDEAVAGGGTDVSPLDMAPHLWRECEARLLAYEQIYRSASTPEAAPPAAALEELVTVFGMLAAGTAPPSADATGLTRRALRTLSVEPPQIGATPSLALAERLAVLRMRPLAPEELTLSQKLPALLACQDRAAFEATLKELPATRGQFAELRLADQLASIRELPWAAIRLALETRRDAERVAARLHGFAGWLEPAMERADRWRLAGERALLDNLGADAGERATVWLTQARQEYQHVEERRQLLQEAARLNVELLWRATGYVRWFAAADSQAPAGAPSYRDLRPLFDTLGEQQQRLDRPDPAHLDEIARLHARLQRQQVRTETALHEPFIDILIDSAETPGAASRIEAILATALPDAATRFELLRAAERRNQGFASGTAAVVGAAGQLPSHINTSTSRWQRLRELADLQVALLRLANGADADPRELAGVLDAQRRIGDLARKLDEAGSNTAEDELWPAWRSLETAVQSFYRQLPEQIKAALAQNEDLSDPATRPQRWRRLREARRALALLDPRDADRVADVHPARHLAEADLFDQLGWQRQRLVLAEQDAAPDERHWLVAAANVYRDSTERIARQPMPVPSPPATVELIVPESLSLVTTNEQDIEVAIRQAGAAPVDAWILLDYDPDRLEILPGDSRVVYHEPQLRRESKRMADYPYRPDPAQDAPTLQLRPGMTERLRLTVRRRSGASSSTQIVAKVVTRTAHIRQSVQVALPYSEAIELVVRDAEGKAGSWTDAAEGVVLHPFPNQESGFRFALRNQGNAEQTVSVDLLVPLRSLPVAVPAAVLASGDADRLLRSAGPMRALASAGAFVVPSDRSTVAIPFAPVVAVPPPAPETSPSPAGAAPAAGAQPVSLRHGFLLVVRNEQAGWTMIEPVGVAPQRPRRYLRAHVGYDLEREQINVRFSSRQPEMLPAAGVRVRCELAGALAATAESVASQLSAPDFSTALFIPVATARDRVAELHIHVDGFPRAFVYQVPCDVDSRDIPEQADRCSVRITHPAEGAIVSPEATTIPVDLQVDAPVGAFQAVGDFIEVGVDRDRDRVIANETPLRLYSDRQADALLVQVAEDGLVTIATRVGDLHVELPLGELDDRRVDVVAQVVAGRLTTWNDPLTVVLDSAAPEVMAPADQAVLAGSDVVVPVAATDNGLSGIASVEVALDSARLGRFVAEPPPVVAEATADGSWVARIPTADIKPGDYRLLVRATDLAGNVSRLARAGIRILTEEQQAQVIAAKVNQVRGTVLSSGEPVAGASIVLTPEKGEPLPAVTSDDRGRFTVADVPPGKYTLKARAIVRNKPRTASSDVQVEPFPADMPLQRIVVP